RRDERGATGNQPGAGAGSPGRDLSSRRAGRHPRTDSRAAVAALSGVVSRRPVMGNRLMMSRLWLSALGSAALLVATPLAAQTYDVTPRIYGGDDAASGDWPWMTLVSAVDVNNPAMANRCGGV